MLFVVPVAIAYEQGDYELTLSGSGSSDESFDGTVFNIEAGLGYFMTRNFEVVGRQGISYADIPGGDKIHSKPDNHGNIPERYTNEIDEAMLSTGDAGSRIACGIIKRK